MELLPRRFARLAAGALCAAAVVFPAPAASAAVVRGVRAIVAASATHVIVEIDGEFRYRTQASEDGSCVLVDIEGATLGAGAARVLPVSDRRVDGVIVLTDAAAHLVRVSVDVAGLVAPRLEASIDSSRLILTFVDVAAAPAKEEGRPEPSRAVSAAGPAAARRPPAESPRVAKPARPAGAVATAPARKSIVQKPVVVLDPGHGGKDPGATSWTGELEKNIVLDLADRVARRLRKGGDVEVVMTRSADEYVALADRRDASRRWGADVFVSIHANASTSAAARGIETYYHSRSSRGSGAEPADRATRRLARVENAGGGTRDRSATRSAVARASLSSASPPLLDRRAESVLLARLVQTELVRQLGMRYEAVRDLGAKEGPFFVIGDNAAPSVLVEAAFLTHREEGLRMRSEVYREQIADGVARGIVAFLAQQRRTGAL